MKDYMNDSRTLIKRGTNSAKNAEKYLDNGEAKRAAEELINGAQDLLTVQKVTDVRIADEKRLLFGELYDLERTTEEARTAIQKYASIIKNGGHTLKELGLEDLESLLEKPKQKTSS